MAANSSSSALASALASASISNCVIWSYICTTAGDKSIPFPPLTSRELEEHYQLGYTTYTTRDGSTTVSFSSMRLTSGPRGVSSHTTIKRKSFSLPSSPPIMAYWTWDSGYHEGHLPYIIQASVDIENGHLKKLSSIDLSTTPSHIPYTVDYIRMQQYRHGYGTYRDIRRVVLLQPLQEILSDQSTLKTTSLSVSSHRSHISPASSILSSSSSTSTYSTSSKRKGSSTSTHISKASSTTPPSVRPSPSSTVPLRTSPSSVSPLTSGPITRSKTRGKGPAATTVKSGGATTTVVREVDKRRDNELEKILGPLSKFVKRTSVLNFGEDGPCPICMNNLSEESGFEEETLLPPSTSSRSSCDVCKLKKCGHLIHTPCLMMYSKNSSEVKGCIRCPTCKVIHGIHTGDMPNTGSMRVSDRHFSLPGHEGYQAIEIVYNFSPGVQNGVHYRASGFPRICYLPSSPKGQKVLKLLKIAWTRRLTFTIGTSVTTGATNTIVWNEIHHKTEAHSNSTGHGYPDENYLDNVLGELAAQGVIDEEGEGGGEGDGDSSDSDL